MRRFQTNDACTPTFGPTSRFASFGPRASPDQPRSSPGDSSGRRCAVALLCRTSRHGAPSSSIAAPYALLWDLDNLRPPSPTSQLLPAIEAIQAIVQQRAAVRGSPSVRLYANSTTCGSLGPQLQQQLLAAGVAVCQVRTRWQAADMQLVSDVFALIQQREQHGDAGCQSTASSCLSTGPPAGCLVLVSNDTGFAPLLEYASSRSFVSVVVASFPSPKKLPGLLPDLRAHPLARHCHAALSWLPPRSGRGSSSQRGRVPLSGSTDWEPLQDSPFIEAVWRNSSKVGLG